MKKALIFIAEGFEEIEAITLIDILRRADVQVDICSISDALEVTGSHGITIKTDIKLSEVENAEIYDAIITPGGLPGSTNLRDHKGVIDIFQRFFDKPNKVIASICASPIVLGKAGIGPQITGTCYPGFEQEAAFKDYKKEGVVLDKNVLTSMGPGTAFQLALKLTEVLVGEQKAQELYEQTMIKYS